MSSARYVIGGLALVTGVVIFLVSRGQAERGVHASPEPRDARLEHVAVYSANAGFAVCSRAPLHRCTITHTAEGLSGTRTERIGPVDVGAVATCTDMVARALEQCGAMPEPGHETPSWLRCAGEHGFFGEARTEVVDPRDVDPRARPGDAVLRCDEGHLSVRVGAP